jgi:hypothetical protein
MSSAKVALACALCAFLLTACGTAKKPEAGTIAPTATTAGYAKLDDPRVKHVKCLEQHHVPVREVGGTQLQIDAPGRPAVQFEPTPGAAQAAQFTGQVTGAEVIGSALLYPNQASDKLLQVVEDCMALGVKG